jgi:aminomethyltransferase
VLPCGLGARDTLRTEMGYPLHGQDLSLEITPCRPRTLGGRLGQGALLGREALVREKEQGAGALLWGPRVARPRHPAQPHAVQRDGAASARSPAGRSRRPGASGIGLALLDRAWPRATR